MKKPRSYDVIVIGGFGHVGLPLGIVLAHKGFTVGLLDTAKGPRAMIESGRMPFIDIGAEPLLKKEIGKRLFVCDGIEDIQRAKDIIVTIGTPVDEYLNPKTAAVLDLFESLSPMLTAKHCVILRSTLFPGTMESLRSALSRRRIKSLLAYCPERIVQGDAVHELQHLPQVISGFTPAAIQRAKKLFSKLGVETLPVSVTEAELVKLFSNAWRYIQFAITNQFFMLAQERGADYDRVLHAMKHKYERNKSLPTPGFAAGPCLLKDTIQLAASYGNRFQLGQAAMNVNEGLPNFVVEQLLPAVAGKTVGILGMAFKANVDDTRDSLSFKLAKILKFKGAHVICSDPYAKDSSFRSLEETVKESDILVVGVPHGVYRRLKIPKGKKAVDIWNVLPVKG